MKKIITTSLLFSTMLVVGGQTVATFAAESIGDSEGIVKFREGTTIDPENPENPDPENPIGPGVEGPLAIVQVSNWDFGELAISVKSEQYRVLNTVTAIADPITGEATGETATSNPFIQTGDLTGSGLGWTLKLAQEDQFTSNANAESKLNGSELTITGTKYYSDTITNTAVPEDMAGDVKLAPEAGSVNLVTAAPNHGVGSWFTAFNKSDERPDNNVGSELDNTVTLDVPSGAPILAGDTYTTQLNWTLTNAPK